MRKFLKPLFSLLLAASLSGSGGNGAEQKPFLAGNRNEDWKLTPYSKWIALPDGGTALEIDIKPDDPIRNITYGAHIPLDLSRYRGQQIVISGIFNVKNVPAQKNGSYSVKLMLYHQGESGTRYIPSAYGLWGTFRNNRQELSFTVPEDVGKNLLMVGMQCNRGLVQVRDLKLEVRDFYPAPVPLPADFRCEYSDAVRNTPRLRGAGIRSVSSLKDAEDLAKEGANLMRWWIQYDFEDKTLKDLDRVLDKLEKLAPEYEKLGLKVIPVLCNVPGGRFKKPEILGINSSNITTRSQSNFQLFFNKEYLDLYIKAWETIARRFKDAPAIYGYSIMNEPSQFGRVTHDYLYCQYLAAKAIRKIDPEKPICIASNNWDKADAFSYLKPLPFKNIIYEVHMYTPYSYTHQGVGDTIKAIKEGKYKAYPGRIGDSEYNRTVLRKSLQPVVDFQKKYGAKVYCGEFSVIRWAPGAAQYLEDLCSIFEELGWDWAYHCYREWINWSFEHPDSYGNDRPAKTPTERGQVLRKYWAKNRKSKEI